MHIFFFAGKKNKKYAHLTLLLVVLDDLLLLHVVGRVPSPAAIPHCGGVPLLALLDGMLLLVLLSASHPLQLHPRQHKVTIYIQSYLKSFGPKFVFTFSANKNIDLLCN